MASEIVHDDNVAGLEDRQELLLDVGAEAFAVDRTVEHARGCEPVAAQCAEEGQRPPAAVWREAPQALAWTPSGYYMASPGGEDLIGWHVNRG